MGKLISRIQNTLTLETIHQLPRVEAARNFYKKIGKDPSRYRISSEALLRRIYSNKGMYYINNVVDINNLISIDSHFSVGSYDVSRLKAPLQFSIGDPHEQFTSFGGKIVNLENLPLFDDSIGPYGSPTCDSDRAIITNTTNHLLMVVISFSGIEGIEIFTREAITYLKEYASATHIESRMIT